MVQDPQVGTLARSRYGGPGARPVVAAYKQQMAAPQAAYGSTYAPRSYNATASYNAGGQNFTIKAVSTQTGCPAALPAAFKIWDGCPDQPADLLDPLQLMRCAACIHEAVPTQPLCWPHACQVTAAVPGKLALAANNVHQANALRCSAVSALVQLPCCNQG